MASGRWIWFQVNVILEFITIYHTAHSQLGRFCTPKQLSLSAITRYDIPDGEPALITLLRVSVKCYFSAVLLTTSYKPEHHRDQNLGLVIAALWSSAS